MLNCKKYWLPKLKKTKDREWLKEVSNIPLQQSLNDLNTAYQNFFNSYKVKRKGKTVNNQSRQEMKMAVLVIMSACFYVSE